MSNGFGGSPWGSGAWGGPLSLEGAPLIIPLSPQDGAAGVGQSDPISIRFTDDVGINPATVSVVIGGVAWVVGGVPVNGAQMDSAPNAFNGLDITLRVPVLFANASSQEVQAFVSNINALSSSLAYTFYVGAALRLLQAKNPIENMLLAYFNRPLKNNAAFYRVSNWAIAPLTAADHLDLLEVVARPGRSDIAHLRVSGGSSGAYRLTVRNLLAVDESELETGFDTADFVLAFPAEREPTIRLFDSIFGPLGVSHQVVQRRTMDGHVADRALAAALDEQLKIRMQRLDATSSPGKPGRGRI